MAARSPRRIEPLRDRGRAVIIEPPARPFSWREGGRPRPCLGYLGPVCRPTTAWPAALKPRRPTHAFIVEQRPVALKPQ